MLSIFSPLNFQYLFYIQFFHYFDTCFNKEMFMNGKIFPSNISFVQFAFEYFMVFLGDNFLSQVNSKMQQLIYLLCLSTDGSGCLCRAEDNLLESSFSLWLGRTNLGCPACCLNPVNLTPDMWSHFCLSALITDVYDTNLNTIAFILCLFIVARPKTQWTSNSVLLPHPLQYSHFRCVPPLGSTLVCFYDN